MLKFYYNFFQTMSAEVLKIIENHSYNHIIWFGNALYIPTMNEILAEIGSKIEFVIDNDKSKWGKIINWENSLDGYSELKKTIVNDNIQIQPPNKIKGMKNTAIFIASKYEKEMREQVRQYGIPEADIYSFNTDVANCILKKSAVLNVLDGRKLLDLKEIQNKEFILLKDFKEFCEGYSLKYYLGGGTLLGAIRHQGFIPWDDDIDVHMPYEDYLKFLELYQKKGKYEALYWENDNNFILQAAHLVDDTTWLVHPGYPIQFLTHLHIDIIPLGGWPTSQDDIDAKWIENDYLDDIWKRYYISRDVPNLPLIDNREKIMTHKFERSFYNSEMVGQMYGIFRHVDPTSARGFEKEKDVLFENEHFRAPIGFEEYLKQRYGNYMELPPENQRIAHSFFIYERK